MAKAIKKVAIGLGALALVATGVGAVALGGLAGTLTIAGVSTSTLLYTASGLAVASSLLQKAPKVPTAQTDRLTASIDPRAFRKTILGQTAFPIDVRYEEWSGKDQEYCDWIVAFASHAIDGLDEIWFDTELAWSAKTGVAAKYRGYFTLPNLVLEGSPANAFSFGAGKWNGSARLTGCAYARFRFKVTGNSKKAESPFSGGIPSRITAIGRGAKLYDPRRDSTVPGGNGPMRAGDQSTWRYTATDGAVIGENLALHVLRVLLGWRIRNPATGELRLATGSGIPARRIDLQSFIVAANLADELVSRSAGGQEARFHGASVVSEGDDPKTTLDMLCAACCGRFRDTGGKLALSIAHNDLANAAIDDGLGDDDVVGAFTWDPDPALDATPNVVRGRYVDASTNSLYQLIDYPEVRIASADGMDRILTLDLGAVESPSQAQRIAKQVLQRKQYQREFTAPFDIRAWKYPVGSVVPFTFAPLGFTRALFRVAAQELGQGGACVMTLVAEHASIYSWDRDDRAPVQAAEAIVYDGSKNPLILAIDDAATTAIWENVADPNGTKPDPNATNGRDPASPFGPNGATVGEAIATLDRIEPIGRDVSALQDAKVGHDEALARLETEIAPLGGDVAAVKEAQLGHAAALERLGGVQADLGAAQRQADRAVGKLDEALLRVLSEASRTRNVMRDAGFVVDAATGIVRLYAVDQLAERTAQAELTLDAQKAQIASKASATWVSEQIALAVLNPEQVAELGAIIARLTSAEQIIDGLNAAIVQKASLEELTTLGGRIVTTEQTLDALAGTISQKAERDVVDRLGVQLGLVQQELSALPNTTGYTVTIRQARAAADGSAEASLGALLAGDDANRRQITQAAEVRQELFTRIDDGLLAEATARLQLAAEVGTARAQALEETTARVEGDRALTERVEGLSATSKEQSASILETNRVLADTAQSLTIRIAAGEAVYNDPATGLVATRTRLMTQETGLADLKRATAERFGSIDAQFANTNGRIDGAADAAAGAARDVATVQASVRELARATAEQDAAAAEAVRQVDAKVGDVRAKATEETNARIEGDRVQAERVDAVAATGRDQAAAIGELRKAAVSAAGGVAGVETTIRQVAAGAEIGDEALLRALIAGDVADRGRQTQLVQLRTELTTTLIANEEASATARQSLVARMGAAEAAIIDTTRALANTTQSLLERIAAGEAVFNDAATGLAATRVQLLAQEKGIADLKAATAERFSSVDAQFGNVGKRVDGVDQTAKGAADSAAGAARVASDVQASVAALAKVTAENQQASATSIQQVTARLDGVGNVGIEQAFNAVADRVGKIEGTYTVKVDSNGNVVGFQLVGSDTGAGSLNLINTDLRMGTGRIIFNNGTFMLVQGVGFGEGSAFIEWYGPSQPSIAACSFEDAISYKTNDGRSVFRGALGPGGSPQSASTSDVGASQLTTPAWAKAGTSMRIQAAFSYSISGSRDKPTQADPPSVTLVLYRKLGTAAEVEVGRKTIRGSAVYEPDLSPSYYSQDVSGSLTYIDADASNEPRTWRLVRSLTVPPVGGSSRVPDRPAQSMSVTSTPQA